MDIEKLSSEIEVLKAKVDAFELMVVNHAQAVETLTAKVNALGSSGSSAKIAPPQKKEPMVPVAFAVGKKEYRFKVHKFSIDGKAITAEEAKENPKLLTNIVEKYPGLVEQV